MDNVSIDIKGNSVIVKSTDFIFTNLRIANKKGEVYFDQIDHCTWRINGNQISSILTVGKEDRAMIFYGADENLEISAENFIIYFQGESVVQADNTDIYLYITLDQTLRFIWNQYPSAKSYITEGTIESWEMIHADKMTWVLKVKTLCVPIQSVDFIVSNRKERVTEKIQAAYIDSVRMDGNVYLNSFVLELSIVNILNKILSRIDYEDYDTTVIDFWYTVKSSTVPLTDFKARIPFSTIFEKETWLTYDLNQKLLVRWYETGAGNLSARIGFLKNDIYEYLLSFENMNTKNTNNKIILITEYPYKAQENGLLFFKYLMENQSKFIPYYVVSKSSKDLPLLQPYMSNVLFYKSQEHVEKLFEARYLAHTHTPNYIAPVLTEVVEKQIKSLYKIFLQHGIIGVRNLEYMYGRETHPNLIDKFIVSSEREMKIVRDEMFYPQEDIEITGLARFDRLLDGNSYFDSFKKRKNILIMPSWRKGQEKLADVDFVETDFYKYFSKLINNQQLALMAKRNNLNIKLYLHNNFQKYNHLFHSDFVSIIEAGTVTVQDLLKDNGILITDYSSVGLDFAIQRRPVLYYQFDNELEEQRDENVQDFLPGKVFVDQNDLVKEIGLKLKYYKMDKVFRKSLSKNLYKYNDRRASERIFKMLEKIDNSF